MRFLVLLITLFSAISLQAEEAKPAPKFLTNQQKTSFYNQMISEIERLDAEIIETRNHSKAVKWDQFKVFYKDKVIESKNWDELAQNFKDFSKGLVNLHTRTKFLAYNSKPSARNYLNDDILFTYPAKKFYLKSSQAEITHLNSTTILEVYEQFNNYRCRHNNEAGCMDRFAIHLKAGAIKVDGKEITSYKVQSKNAKSSIVPLTYDRKPQDDIDPMTSDYCDNHSGYANFELVFKGHNACLYKKDKEAIVRLRHFLYPDHREPDIYCKNKDTTSSMCKDISGLLENLHKFQPEHLIFDMTYNVGGNENTPILAAFMPNNFMDLPVLFRNQPEMKNKEIRQSLFYGNPNGERWYQEVKDYKGKFFPMRGDFCRGKNGCHLSLIKPHENAYVAKKISVITDWMCVSSCDDFVWRMQQFADAKIYGITPAQDATYARARILLYLDKQGEVQTVITGESYSLILDDADYLLAELIIPYSKTVTLDGKLRNIQGLPVTEVPYTLENQENYPQAVLNHILK